MAFVCIMLMALATSAHAGNLTQFDEPPAVGNDEPMGGSNAAWIIPLVAILAIAATSGGGGGKDDNGASNGSGKENGSGCVKQARVAENGSGGC